MNEETPQSPDRPLPYKVKGDVSDVIGNSPVLKRPIVIGDLTLASPTTNTTIGSNGAATALTANPVGYIAVIIGNVAYQIPYYNVA